MLSIDIEMINITAYCDTGNRNRRNIEQRGGQVRLSPSLL